MSIDTCGGMASDALKLVEAIAEEGERWSAGTWSRGEIERRLLGAIAVAVQRGNALAMLTGYSRAMANGEDRRGRTAAGGMSVRRGEEVGEGCGTE